MAKYRRRLRLPIDVPVEAAPAWTDTKERIAAVLRLGGGISLELFPTRFSVKTASGWVRPEPGDWIVKQPDGLYEILRPSAFRVLYEEDRD